MHRALVEDANMFLSRWGASRKPRWMLWTRLFFLTPGFQFVFWLRVQRSLSAIPLLGPALRRVIWYCTTIWFACDVDPQVKIGPGLYTPHPLGIVIGGGVSIGKNVSILQNVTLGRVATEHLDPTIGDDVEIGAGAVVLGSVCIGNGAKVGANSVVLKDVPARAIAVGAPARVIVRAGPTEAPVTDRDPVLIERLAV
jgi:serine O-acetyltransferase